MIEIVDRIGAFCLLDNQCIEECHWRLVPGNQMVARAFLKRMNRDFLQEINVLNILFSPVPLRFLSLHFSPHLFLMMNLFGTLMIRTYNFFVVIVLIFYWN